MSKNRTQDGLLEVDAAEALERDRSGMRRADAQSHAMREQEREPPLATFAAGSGQAVSSEGADDDLFEIA